MEKCLSGYTKTHLKKCITRSLLKKAEYDYLLNALGAFSRLIPHIETDLWILKKNGTKSKASWRSINGQQRRAIGLEIFIPSLNYSIESLAKRKIPGDGVANVSRVLDNTEMGLCKKIVQHATESLEQATRANNETILNQIRNDFEDSVILSHLKNINKLDFDLSDLVEFLKQLSEQSYENKALSFGVLIDKEKKQVNPNGYIFPNDFGMEKKFRAFTDGYKSSYFLDKNGSVIGIVDLEKWSKTTKGEHYFPTWSQNMARSCVKNLIGLSLTRQGDILYFENGSLRLTRRFGKWQYWNHAYIIDILKNKGRSQHVKPSILGKVVSKLYKLALDVSFRHSGGLFIILRNQTSVKDLVRKGDGIYDRSRSSLLKDFDKFIYNKSILGIDKNVLMELASIDGALVFSNNGYLLAYGAVVTPKRRAGTNSEEGSRSKAAIGASNYGISIKVSADGGISIYQKGRKFIEI